MSVPSGDTVSSTSHNWFHFFPLRRSPSLLPLSYNAAYVADWKVELQEGAPHEVKDHSVEVRTGNPFAVQESTFCVLHPFDHDTNVLGMLRIFSNK